MENIRNISESSNNDRQKVLQALSCMDTPKRLEALLHERVFGTKVVEFYGKANVSLGWCFTNAYGGYVSPTRKWFRILLPGDSLNDADRAFRDQLQRTRTEDRFYIIRVLPEKNVKKLHKRLACTAWTKKGKDEAPELLKNLVEEYSKRRKKDKESVGTDSRGLDNKILRSRFEKLDFDDLYNETFRRLLLNYCLTYASDIDAVVLENNQLMVFEYKRKAPARGMFPLKHNFSLPMPSIAEFKKAEHNIKKTVEKELRTLSKREMNFAEISKHITQNTTVSDNFSDTRKNGICFGLDLSHASTVELCEESCICYFYLILDSEEKRATKLLNFHNSYIEGLQFRYLKLTMASFTGLTFTEGYDSGSYNNKIRLQLCIPISSFILVSEFDHAIDNSHHPYTKLD